MSEPEFDYVYWEIKTNNRTKSWRSSVVIDRSYIGHRHLEIKSILSVKIKQSLLTFIDSDAKIKTKKENFDGIPFKLIWKLLPASSELRRLLRKN